MIFIVILIILFGFLYARPPSFRHGGMFKKEVTRQRQRGDQHKNELREKSKHDVPKS